MWCGAGRYPAQATTTPAASAASAASPGAVTGGALPGGTRVTLITGDVVTIVAQPSGCARVAVTPATAGRAFARTCDAREHVHVVPAEIAAGLGRSLDPALFDVTGLVASGYDDAHTNATPLIVEYRDAEAASRAAGGAKNGRTDAGLGGRMRSRRGLASIAGVAGRQPKSESAPLRKALPELARQGESGGVTKVCLDRKVTAAPAPVTGESSTNLAQVGAVAAQQAGYTGKGVRVAVLDSGIDVNHPDFAGRIVETHNFTGGQSSASVEAGPHGTHVASIVAGSGAASAGRYRGVAPEAELLIGQVLPYRGSGNLSDIIAGMEWAAPKADIVSMSIGGLDEPEVNPYADSMAALTGRYGALFVVSAGNSGPRSTTIESPGRAPVALTVGAVDATDTITAFSSRGPNPATGGLKPEIVAPGENIVAAKAQVPGEPAGDRYVPMSGTSMAAPHVAGAAALVRQRYPNLAPELVKSALISSADPIGDANAYTVGAGRLNVQRALSGPVSSTGVANLGVLEYPQSGTATATLTWTDPASAGSGSGSAPAARATARATAPASAAPAAVSATTLNLAVSGTDQRGAPIAPGALTLSATQVSVGPAAGGSVTVSVDRPRLAAVTGYYSAIVTADDGHGRVLRTPVAFKIEGPMSNLTVKTTRIPSAADWGTSTSVYVVNLDDPELYSEPVTLVKSDTRVLRVPAGRYSVVGTVTAYPPESGGGAVGLATSGAAGRRQAIAGDPEVDVSGDAIVVVDGAAAKPVSVAVEGVATQVRSTLVELYQEGAGGTGWSTELRSAGGVDDVLVAPMTGSASAAVTSTVAVALDRPGTGPSPYRYDLAFTGTGFSDGPSWHLGQSEQAKLARVDNHSRRSGSFTTVDYGRFTWTPGRSYLGYVTTDAAADQTDYVTAGTWSDFMLGHGAGELQLELYRPTRTLAAGGREVADWGRSPLHPDWLDIEGNPVGCNATPAVRAGNVFAVSLVELTDVHAGYGCLAGSEVSYPNARLALYRDDNEAARAGASTSTKIGESASSAVKLELPAEPGSYRLVHQQRIVGAWPVDTEATTTWTFRSQAPASGVTAAVPLLSLDYQLPLDDSDRLPAATAATGPAATAGPAGAAATAATAGPARFAVRQLSGTTPQRITAAKVWISTDDGKSWTEAPVTLGEDATFTAPLPGTAGGTVAGGTAYSLKVSAVGDGGSAIEQTLIRAFHAA